MKYIPLFEDFLNESKMPGVPRTTPPSSYAPESFWNKAFHNGKIGNPPHVDRPEYKSVIASISYDLGLGFGIQGSAETPMTISYYGDAITDGQGRQKIVKDGLENRYTYAELRDAVEKWAKKKRYIK